MKSVARRRAAKGQMPELFGVSAWSERCGFAKRDSKQNYQSAFLEDLWM
jgi:hypothetical protein